MRFLFILAIAAILINGCSDDKGPTMPSVPRTCTLSGTVRNQFGQLAPDLKMIVSDTRGFIDSVVTDSTAAFSFSGLNKGLVSIEFRPTTTVVAYLPRYLYAQTIIDVAGDTVQDFIAREFHEIFHDDGTGISLWEMFGGVSQADSAYVFTDNPGQSDSMIMVTPVQLPDIEGPVRLLVEGLAAPSDSGLIQLRIIRDGAYPGSPHNLVFTADTSYKEIFPAELVGQYSSMIQLDLAFQRSLGSIIYPASSVRITDIWIFSY